MDGLDKLYRFHHILLSRRTPISRADLMQRLEVSWPTLKRLIREMHDCFDAPVRRAYNYSSTQPGNSKPSQRRNPKSLP
jgi:predicted DNA-binding transcriptional regulator YafY